MGNTKTGAATPTTTVTRVEDFVQSIGVNTHMGNPSMGYGDVEVVLKELNYLGIDHIRDWIPEQIWPLQYYHLSTLASAGIQLHALLPNINPIDLDSHMEALHSFALAHPGAIASVEGPNEVDVTPITYQGLEGASAVRALQKDLYAAVHGDSALAGVPVYNFTLAWTSPASYGIGDMSAYADYANVHGYVPNGVRPKDVLPNLIKTYSSNVAGKPIVVTETNYYTLPQDSNWGGVNEDVQAKYGLYTVLDNWKAGVSMTFFYELRDQAIDLEREHNFGVFKADGTPKEFATALHNMTAILSDTGYNATSFSTTPLKVSFSGLPQTASNLVMQESDGTHQVILWDEQQLWDPDNHVQLPATTSDVTLSFKKTFASILIFDPTESTEPTEVYHNVNRVTLELSDAPMIVQLSDFFI
ncbi:hypothetical protein AAII07_54910 [Microvirga sp. 0TCS3.31]